MSHLEEQQGKEDGQSVWKRKYNQGKIFETNVQETKNFWK